MKRRNFLLLACSLAAFHGARAETVTYSTGDFVSAQWSSVISGTGTSVASTEPSGGRPGAYRRVSLTVGPHQDVANWQLWSVAVYTPARQGPVTSVSLSYDLSRVYTSNPGATQIAKGIAVQQGGVIYSLYQGVSTVAQPSWESLSVADLVPLFPAVNWTNGTEITFGFLDSVSTSETGFTIDGGYDNFTVTVNYTPAPQSATYYFPHLAVGGIWQTTLTYVNYSPQAVTCDTTFFSDSGAPLVVPFAGIAASSRRDTILPGASIHEQTQGDPLTPVAVGWAQAQCTGPVKASLLFRSYSQGIPTGEAGVNAMTSPTAKFVTFAETQTGVAFANPSTQPATITITALNTEGSHLGSRNLTLKPGEHGSAFVTQLLNLQSFTGSAQVISTVPIVSLALNLEAAPVFSSLPPGDLTGPTPPAASYPYYFAHMAVGGGWQTTITYVNLTSQAVTCETEFLSNAGAPLFISFGGSPISSRTHVIAPEGTVHEQTQGDPQVDVVTGWARAQCSGPVKASLLFRSYDQSLATGEAGVNAMTVPATKFAGFAETQTGLAYANPSAQPASVTVTVLDAEGRSLGSKTLEVQPGQHGASFVRQFLGLSDFTGSVQMTATVPVVSLSLNLETAPVFSSLPPGELDSSTPLSGP